MDIELQIERALAANDCRNLLARYSMYHLQLEHYKYVDLWAKRDDCIFDAPWGIYDGFEGVRRCYLEDHGDRSMPEAAEYFKGCMNIHHFDTVLVEVAADAKTAQAAWMSPGIQSFNRPFDPEVQANWTWSCYSADLIKEDGEWKFWHMRLWPIFCTPFDTPWTKAPIYEGTPSLEDQISRPSPEKPWNYSKDALYPTAQPWVPAPYKTWSEVGCPFCRFPDGVDIVKEAGL